MTPRSRVKFALVANTRSKAEAETLRKRYKQQGTCYTEVKKSPYGGYDVRVGVHPLGPEGLGGEMVILTGKKKKEMEKW